MTRPITSAPEFDRAIARRARLAALLPHLQALIEAVDHPDSEPLLMDAGRYVGLVLEEFTNDLLAEQEALTRAITAYRVAAEVAP